MSATVVATTEGILDVVVSADLENGRVTVSDRCRPNRQEEALFYHGTAGGRDLGEQLAVDGLESTVQYGDNRHEDQARFAAQLIFAPLLQLLGSGK